MPAATFLVTFCFDFVVHLRELASAPSGLPLLHAGSAAMQAEIVTITKVGGPLTKRIHFDEDGCLKSDYGRSGRCVPKRRRMTLPQPLTTAAGEAASPADQTPTGIRVRLFERGFQPLPLNGKSPEVNGKSWQQKRQQTNVGKSDCGARCGPTRRIPAY
jgi:hypothetical protein